VSYRDKTKINNLLELIEKFQADIPISLNEAEEVIASYVRSIRTSEVLPSYHPIKKLERKWYDSLLGEEPNYSVYADPYYVCEAWACWALYSNKSIKALNKDNALINRSVIDLIHKAKIVVDAGCGIGYSTAFLKELLPDSHVIGTNLPGTLQYRIANEIADEAGFEMATGLENLGPVDVVFASEYFEHFQHPFRHVLEIIEQNRPEYIITINSFTGIAIGHFPIYLFTRGLGLTDTIPNKAAGRTFGRVMRNAGYAKLKTKIWNDRPSIWQKQP